MEPPALPVVFFIQKTRRAAAALRVLAFTEGCAGSEFLAVDPQPQRGVGDIIDFFAVHGVIAVVQLFRVIFLCQLVIACAPEADAFDLLLGNFFHGVGDGEASIGRAMNQMLPDKLISLLEFKENVPVVLHSKSLF